jgi:RNA polymerase sigma-70 factor (ECF subfamily)
VLPVSPAVTDEALLLRIRQGEREAVLAAYEAHFAALFQYVRLRLADAAAAEDIVSDVFVRLIECAGTPRAPEKHLRGWLFQVAKHLLADSVPRQRQVPLAEVEDWMPASPETNPEVAAGDLLDRQRVSHALRMLTPDHQEVLLLRFGQRLSLQETADMMGKSLSAIKSLQFRAVATLRGLLSDTQPEVSRD